MNNQLRERAANRWSGILPALGISESFLKNKHGPCPMCGGKDRWRFDDKGGSGTWFCSHCGAGDGIKLVMLHAGVDFRSAAALIEVVIGACAPRRAERQERRGDGGASLWRMAVPVGDDPAGAYLRRRCGLQNFPPDLRYAEAIKYAGAEPKWFPTLLALVRDMAGNPVNVARTYLTDAGDKAAVDAPRKLCAGPFPYGAAVRLWPPQDRCLLLAEGLETTISAARRFGRPGWAMLTAGNLARSNAPDGVTDIIIAGDCDDSFTGQAAAYVAARRIKMRPGGILVRVEVPGHRNDEHCDWNDVETAEAIAS